MSNNGSKKPSVVNNQRLASLDALRGFDMLWITGGGLLFIRLAQHFSCLKPFVPQFEHVDWTGFRFEDLIFPLFVFISGIALAFSMYKRQQEHASGLSVTLKSLRRSLLLIFFGACMGGFFTLDWENVRWCSVLGTFGVSGFLGGLIVFRTRRIRSLVFWAIGFFAVIAVLQLFVKVDGYGGTFEKGKMINSWFDHFLPGRLYGGSFDPEGPLNMVSATVLILLGASVGRFIIVNNDPTEQMKNVGILIGIGAILICLGLAMSPWYPIIKKAWTGSFNVLTAGIGMCLFAIFYCIIDVCRFHRWSFPFQVIGVNAITIYLMRTYPGFGKITDQVFCGLIGMSGEWGSVVEATGTLLIEWLVLYFFWRKRIFLRL